MSEINDLYRNLLSKIYNEGRTTGNTKELLNYSFTLNDISDNVVAIEGRHQPHYTIGELLWYWSGRNDVEFIKKFGSYWDKITDDGITSNSAYGYILMKKFGYNQIELAIRQLKEDPNSRRAIMNINTPSRNKIITRDLQCTISLVPYIRDNKVYMTAIMRSNDIITGVPYDVTYFTEVQKYIAKRLGLETGSYTHFDVSLHLYEKDFDKVEKIVNGADKNVKYNLELLHNEDIVNKLITYVDNNWTNKDEFVTLCKDLGVYEELD